MVLCDLCTQWDKALLLLYSLGLDIKSSTSTGIVFIVNHGINSSTISVSFSCGGDKEGKNIV